MPRRPLAMPRRRDRNASRNAPRRVTALTPPQQAVALVIQRFRDRIGRGPSLAEMGASLGGLSKPAVFDRLRPLVSGGSAETAMEDLLRKLRA